MGPCNIHSMARAYVIFIPWLGNYLEYPFPAKQKWQFQGSPSRAHPGIAIFAWAGNGNSHARGGEGNVTFLDITLQVSHQSDGSSMGR